MNLFQTYMTLVKQKKKITCAPFPKIVPFPEGYFKAQFFDSIKKKSRSFVFLTNKVHNFSYLWKNIVMRQTSTFWSHSWIFFNLQRASKVNKECSSFASVFGQRPPFCISMLRGGVWRWQWEHPIMHFPGQPSEIWREQQPHCNFAEKILKNIH